MIEKYDVKQMDKIRKLLGNRFHLCVKLGSDMKSIEEWHLFKRYDDAKVYFSEDNEEIMSSKTHTIEILYDFAKKHHKIDEHQAICKLIIGMLWAAFAVVLLNMIFWDSDSVRAIVITIDFVCILINVVMHFIWNKNWKVDMYELDENYKQTMKELMEGFKKKNGKNDKKRI